MSSPIRTLSAEQIAVRKYNIEQTLHLGTTNNDSFESKLSARERNPHFGWRPVSSNIREFQFENVVLDGEFRGLFSEGHFVQGTGYLVPDETMAQFTISSPISIEQNAGELAIVGCNVAYSNYYHWITQALPAIDHAVRRFRETFDVSLVLPNVGRWQEESLRLLNLDEIKRVVIRDNTRGYFFRHILFSEYLCGSTAFTVSSTIADTYRRLRESVQLPATQKKKVYVARLDATARKMRNEKQLIENLSRFGYEIVVPGSMSLAEQINTFRAADIVVGPHGAGLTNIVFCKPNTIIYELLPSHYTNGCFCNLAYTCGLRYWQDIFESVGEGQVHLRDWSSDTEFVLRRISEIESIERTEIQRGRSLRGGEYRPASVNPTEYAFLIFGLGEGMNRAYFVRQSNSGAGRQYSIGGFPDKGAAEKWIKSTFPGGSIIMEEL